MGNFSSRVFAGSVLVFTLIACGDDDSDIGPAPPPTDATMTAISSTLCEKIKECTSDYLITIGYGTLDGCTARTKQQFTLDLKAAGYGVTDAAAQTCLSAVKSAACTDILDNKLPDACHFKGTLADGSNCTTDAQCQSGSCFVDDAATCGKCGPRTPSGADCTNSQCDYGLICNGSKLCSNGALGAACTRDSDCHAFTVCRAGVCTALLEENAACVPQPGANDPPCNLLKGLHCAPATRTCTKFTVKFAANGEKCDVTSVLPFEFTACTNGECVKPGNTCVAHIADGAACTGNEDGKPKCQGPAKCRASVCSLKDPGVCK